MFLYLLGALVFHQLRWLLRGKVSHTCKPIMKFLERFSVLIKARIHLWRIHCMFFLLDKSAAIYKWKHTFDSIKKSLRLQRCLRKLRHCSERVRGAAIQSHIVDLTRLNFSCSASRNDKGKPAIKLVFFVVLIIPINIEWMYLVCYRLKSCDSDEVSPIIHSLLTLVRW